jgi:hypothetical protein
MKEQLQAAMPALKVLLVGVAGGAAEAVMTGAAEAVVRDMQSGVFDSGRLGRSAAIGAAMAFLFWLRSPKQVAEKKSEGKAEQK